MRPVTVQSLKNPDIIHWGFEAAWLGEDRWGDWIALPAGSSRWKGEEMLPLTRNDAVLCAPRDQWWHLHYEGAAADRYSAFIDIATPPTWVSENRYEMIDLDLDIAVLPDGIIEVQDEDEFEVHQVRYGYTAEMIGRARAETDRILNMIHRGDEPFFEVAENWLTRLHALA